MPDITVIEGDLLDQPVDAIVNTWNRNVIPWWLLLPQGVSGAIKRRAGYAPFIELGRNGPIPLGKAVLTSAGRLPHKGIIHVAGINLLWKATAHSIQESVRSAMELVHQHGFASVAFPLIGAATGSFGEAGSERLMLKTLAQINSDAQVIIVRFRERT